jgi:hypothetical protein
VRRAAEKANALRDAQRELEADDRRDTPSPQQQQQQPQPVKPLDKVLEAPAQPSASPQAAPPAAAGDTSAAAAPQASAAPAERAAEAAVTDDLLDVYNLPTGRGRPEAPAGLGRIGRPQQSDIDNDDFAELSMYDDEPVVQPAPRPKPRPARAKSKGADRKAARSRSKGPAEPSDSKYPDSPVMSPVTPPAAAWPKAPAPTPATERPVRAKSPPKAAPAATVAPAAAAATAATAATAAKPSVAERAASPGPAERASLPKPAARAKPLSAATSSLAALARALGVSPKASAKEPAAATAAGTATSSKRSKSPKEKPKEKASRKSGRGTSPLPEKPRAASPAAKPPSRPGSPSAKAAPSSPVEQPARPPSPEAPRAHRALSPPPAAKPPSAAAAYAADPNIEETDEPLVVEIDPEPVPSFAAPAPAAPPSPPLPAASGRISPPSPTFAPDAPSHMELITGAEMSGGGADALYGAAPPPSPPRATRARRKGASPVTAELEAAMPHLRAGRGDADYDEPAAYEPPPSPPQWQQPQPQVLQDDELPSQREPEDSALPSFAASYGAPSSYAAPSGAEEVAVSPTRHVYQSKVPERRASRPRATSPPGVRGVRERRQSESCVLTLACSAALDGRKRRRQRAGRLPAAGAREVSAAHVSVGHVAPAAAARPRREARHEPLGATHRRCPHRCAASVGGQGSFAQAGGEESRGSRR